MIKRNVPNKKGDHLYVIPHWHIDMLSHFQMSVPLAVDSQINVLTYGIHSKVIRSGRFTWIDWQSCNQHSHELNNENNNRAAER